MATLSGHCIILYGCLLILNLYDFCHFVFFVLCCMFTYHLTIHCYIFGFCWVTYSCIRFRIFLSFLCHLVHVKFFFFLILINELCLAWLDFWTRDFKTFNNTLSLWRYKHSLSSVSVLPAVRYLFGKRVPCVSRQVFFFPARWNYYTMVIYTSISIKNFAIAW